MGSTVVALLVCGLSASLIPSAWADSCESYTSLNGKYHPFDFCFHGKHCCGTCAKRYCCDNELFKFSRDEQELCTDWPSFEKKTNTFMILASILGIVVPLVICVGLIVCFVAPCCMLYKKCRKQHHQGQAIGTVTTVVNTPLQQATPHGYQLAYLGYQPVPVHAGPGALCNPVAPPPYGGPPAPIQPSYPSQAYGPPPNELSQPPFNPAYNPHS